MAAPALTARFRVLVIAAGLYACAVHAQEVPPPAYQLAAQRAGIPSTVLYAVALQESGIRRNGRIVPWPWSLNVAGQSRRYATRADACAGLQQAMRSTPHTRIDAGLGQINLGYHKHRFTSPCDLLDPYRNLAIASEILKEQHIPGRTGCWRSAATTAPRGRARSPLPAERFPPPRPRAGHAPNRRGPRRAPGDHPMTKSHLAHLAAKGLLVLLAGLPLASRAGEPLILVEDRGGTSALPYYEALSLQPRANTPARSPIPATQIPATPADEAAMLPVRSAKLTPGTVARRVIEAPGLRPFVVVGDDEASQAWLRRHAASLRERGAVGLVVNVETVQGLARLRALASGVPLAPVSGDDLAERLGLRHYPALVTATGIEQ